MEVKYIVDEKNEAEIEISSLTIAEVLRAYLAKDEDIIFVAWKRAHLTKNPVLKVKTKGKTVRKAIEDAASQIEKEAEKLVDGLKKSK